MIRNSGGARTLRDLPFNDLLDVAWSHLLSTYSTGAFVNPIQIRETIERKLWLDEDYEAPEPGKKGAPKRSAKELADQFRASDAAERARAMMTSMPDVSPGAPLATE